MSNQTKYSFYKKGFSLMKEALENDELHYTISSIAIAESVISDRMRSYMRFKNIEWLNKFEAKRNFISCRDLVKKIDGITNRVEVKVKTKNETLKTSNLFEEIDTWLYQRNDILHAFAKSNNGGESRSIDEFKQFSYETAKHGYKLARLLNKWVKQQKI